MKGKPRTSANFDWGVLLPEVALQLMGEPKTMGSQEWRYGRKGSLKVNLPGSEGAGYWYCFETGTSGGVVDLIEREAGLSPENRHAAAKKWLRDRDLIPAAGERPAKQSPEPPPHSDTDAPAETRATSRDDKDRARRRAAARLWAAARPAEEGDASHTPI